MSDFNYTALRFLHGLVAAKVRRNERAIARFTAKGDQTPDEAARIRSEFEQNLAWQRTILDRIEELELQADR